MDSVGLHTFSKAERLCSRKVLEELFSGGHPSVSAFPLRAVFMPNDVGLVRIMVSVSKRYFKRAVLRNRIKRQLREAYRLQKEALQPLDGGLDIAFLWSSNETLPTEKVFQKMRSILCRIQESRVEKQTAQG